MSFDPAALERAIDQAEHSYQQSLAGLTRPDGMPVYAPDEQRERETAARADFHKAVTSVGEQLDAVIAAAEAEITAVAAEDPTTRFTTPELERISFRTVVVIEDLRHLPETLQLARFRAVLDSSDRVERYVYLRAGHALLAEQGHGSDDEPATYHNGRRVHVPAAMTPLGELVATLERGFSDTTRRERAEARIAAAQGVGFRLAEVRHMAAAYGPLRARRPVTSNW